MSKQPELAADRPVIMVVGYRSEHAPVVTGYAAALLEQLGWTPPSEK
ncbi:hypothetical protein SEA_OTTAWA_14 [Arthrobacter phage Ottawa]|nr:hypothetical protein SEA_KHARCHO_14 [Arthrobacter phage Kharcho]WIC89246.1 hypothetical protein SEA_OTTAWA_14 [Arthrobacter phage Ottawa]